MAEVKLTITGEDKTGPAFKAVQDAAKSAFDQIKSAAAAIVSIGAFEELIRRSTLAAQAAEAYSVSLNILGQNVGYSSDQLDAYVVSMTQLNYTQEDARSALARMIETNINLSNSTKLATIAQDASTVSRQTATEALDIMNFAISTGMTRSLKHMGIIVDFTAAEKKYAEAHGTSTAFLTEQEKVQIRVNEVERAAVTIHGAYAAGMETAEGIMKRLTVATDATRDEFGKLFLPVYKEMLVDMLSVMKDIQKWFEENQSTVANWAHKIRIEFTGAINDAGTMKDFLTELNSIWQMATAGPGKLIGNASDTKAFNDALATYIDTEEKAKARAKDFQDVIKTGFHTEELKKLDDVFLEFPAHIDEVKKSLSGASWKTKVDVIASDATYSINKLKEYYDTRLIDDKTYYTERNKLITQAEDAAKTLLGKETTADAAKIEKNRLAMEQNKALTASYWSVNDAIVKITGSNEDQANAQEQVYLHSKEYLDLVKTAAGGNAIAKAILDEGKHLLSLQAIDAVYKDLTTHLNALKELQGMSQEIQAMDTSTMTDPFAKQQQALKDSYDKQLQDTETYVTQKQALLDQYDKLGISNTDQRYQNESALIQKAKDKELAIDKQYAYNAAMLEQQIAETKAQTVSTSIGQVGQLMMTGNKKEFEAGKALAEAEATINAALAIVKAYGQLGPIYGTVAAVGIVAATAAEISKINSQQYTGKAEGGYISGGIPGVDSVPAMLMPGEVVIKKSAVDFYGLDRLLALNDKNIPHFADGGVVGSSDSSAYSNVVDLAAYKAQKAQKDLLDATNNLVTAVQANTTAVTKVADGLTTISGVFDAVTTYFSGLTSNSVDLSGGKNLTYALDQSIHDLGQVIHWGSMTYDLALINMTSILKQSMKYVSDVVGGSQSITGQGLQLGYSGGALQASSYATVKTDGGWFSSNSYDTQTAALDSQLQKLLDDTTTAIKNSATNAAAALGLTADNINSVVVGMTQLDLSGLSNEDASKAVEAWFQSLGNAFADSLTGLDALVQPGETSYDALIRLAESLQAVNSAATMFGGTVMALSLDNADAASSLVTLMGGLDAFNTAVSNYESKMYTSGEQANMNAAAGYTEMSNALSAVGYAVPATSDQFKAIVNSLDLTTTAGQNAYAAFMSVTDGAAAFYDQAQAIADAATAMSNDLTVRSYTAAGDTVDATLYQLRIDQLAEIKKAEESGLYTTSQILALETVQTQEWAAAVTTASATISTATQSLIDSSKTALTTMLSDQQTILSKMQGLLTTDSSLSPEAAYRAAQANWTSAVSSGDATQMSDAATTLLDASKAYNASGTAYQTDYQTVLDALGNAVGLGSGASIDAVDNQITLLTSISDSLDNGDLATNTTLINQLGTSGALYTAIQAWITETNAGAAESALSAASETYGKAYDTFISGVTADQSAYSSGTMSLIEYTNATKQLYDVIKTAQDTAIAAGVTSFTDSTGATLSIGSASTLQQAMMTPIITTPQPINNTPISGQSVYGSGDTSTGTTTPTTDITQAVASTALPIYGTTGFTGWTDYLNSLPTYDVGSSFLSADQTASLHYGEAVVDAQSNAVLQKYGIKVQASGNNDAMVAALKSQNAKQDVQIAELKQQNKHLAAIVRMNQDAYTKMIELSKEQTSSTKDIQSKTRLAALQR